MRRFIWAKNQLINCRGDKKVAPTIAQDSIHTNLKVSIILNLTTLVQVTPALNYKDSILVLHYGTQIRLKSELSP
jgi:hypothetical protein